IGAEAADFPPSLPGARDGADGEPEAPASPAARTLPTGSEGGTGAVYFGPAFSPSVSATALPRQPGDGVSGATGFDTEPNNNTSAGADLLGDGWKLGFPAEGGGVVNAVSTFAETLYPEAGDPIDYYYFNHYPTLQQVEVDIDALMFASALDEGGVY